MANLASLFAVPLALVAQDVKENQKSHQTLTHPEANQKESNTENGSTKPVEVDVPSATGEIKLNYDHREVAGNKTSPKKKKKKKQNKRMQVHEYIDYDKKAAEEAQLLDSSQWMWNDASAARNHESEPSSSSHRAVICYEELMQPRIFQTDVQWRGRPDPGQERPNNKSALTSGNVLQSVPHLNEAPSPSNIESVKRTETALFNVDSSAGSEKKVHKYIDYDKNLVEDSEMHDPFVRRCTDLAASAASNHNNGAISSSSSQQREVISYEELSCPRNFNKRSRGARGRGQNFHPGQHNLNNSGRGGTFKRQSGYSGPPNKIPRLTGSELVARNNIPPLMPMMPCGFIDPNVAATEKEEMFEKLQPVINPNARKPLSNKQRRKIEKAKFYKEKLRQQLEKEKDRISVQKKLQCRFFSYGNCTKGDDCPFSHDFVPQKKQELCKFYIMSFCEKGASCIYYHNDWPCKFFHVFRSCTQGDACRFSHQPLTDETRPLLEKSLNDGIPNCSPSSSKPLEFSQPITGPNLPPVTTSNETPRTLGDNTSPMIPFYGAENLKHSQTVTGQMPPATNDPGFDPIHQEPWNKKLQPIDLDETHHPQLPPSFESSNPTFLHDPRMERYRTAGKPTERSVVHGNAPDISESVVIGFDSDSCSDSKFLASSSELKSIHSSFVSDGINKFSGSYNVFSAACGAFTSLSSTDSTAKFKEPFSSSCSSSSLWLSTSHMSSGLDNTRSDELKMKTARHFSLPVTRHATRGIGDGRLPRNRATRMAVTSNGPADPALPQPPSVN